MKYLLVLLALILAVVISTIAQADEHGGQHWTPPDACADEDRVVPGNRTTPCRYVFPSEVEAVEYVVHMSYPYCYEAIEVKIPGLLPLDANLVDMRDTKLRHIGFTIDGYGQWNQPHYDWYIEPGYMVLLGRKWDLSSRVDGESNLPSYPSMSLRLVLDTNLGRDYERRQYVESTIFTMPSTVGTLDLVNSCLVQVQNEQEHREYLIELEAQERAEAARLQAELEAARLAEQEAIELAEAQARMAAEEMVAVIQTRERAASEELIRTQALVDEIAHEEALALVLQEVVRIRLSGQEDRARITGEYLTRTDVLAQEFDVETTETEERIQAYLDFNTELMSQIADYQADLENRLETLRQDIRTQELELEALREQATDITDGIEPEDET